MLVPVVEGSVSRKRKIGVKKATITDAEANSASAFANIKQGEPNIYTPLTDELEDATVHYVAGAPGEPGQHIHCNQEVEGECAFCEAEMSPQVVTMMPVVDLRNNELTVLKGAASEKADSLFNQVEQLLLSDPKFPFCLMIEKPNRFSFKVKVRGLDAKHIEKAAYKEARETVSAPGYDLQKLIPRKTNQEILDEFPKVQGTLNLIRDLE